jgi:hypothetical protein
MIQRAFITEWRAKAPWALDEQVELEANLHEKLGDVVFQRDIEPLLATGTTWDQSAAAEYVLKNLAPLLPGEAWKGLREAAQG